MRTRAVRCPIVAGIMVLLSVLPSAAAADFSMNPVADAFVTSAYPDNNYGGAGALAISAAGMPKGEFQSVLQFDTAAAKADFDATFGAGQWFVSSISLQLNAAFPNNPIFNSSNAGQLSIEWMHNDGWAEGTGTPSTPGATGITFATLPGFLHAGDESLGTFSFDGATSGGFSMDLTLASGLLTDVSAGSPASLRLAAADSTVSALFNSRSFGNIAARPALTVTAEQIPEPSTLALLGVGLAVRRRRGRRTS